MLANPYPTGLLERFSLSRQHLGPPSTIVFLATVDGGYEEVRRSLIDRLDVILAQDAILSSGISGATTPEPAFAPTSDCLKAEDVVVKGELDVSSAKDGPANTRAAQILQIETHSLDTVQLHEGPLLRLALYPTKSENGPSCQVALCGCHYDDYRTA